MTNLRYRTLLDVTPLGRPKIFFCALPSEFDEYFEIISNEIFIAQDCSIWYLEKGTKITEEVLRDLEEIPLWVFCVTPEFLLTDNDERCILWDHAVKKHISVLPLIQSLQVKEEFNRRCGEIQWLSIAEMNVSRGLSFRDKLKNRLDEVLIGDAELRNRIFNEFSGRIFLSYRKKDQQEAIEVMKYIHDNKNCRDIAIWYDDYLIPGEEFNQNIHKELEESDCVALVVTPNLLESPNYVMDIEYPEAVKLGKRIIPFEVVKTDEEELRRFYRNIPECITVQKKRKDDNRLNILADEIGRKRERNAEHNYLIGLAYLFGFYMERDIKRGVQLLESAAENGSLEACSKLQLMYMKGEMVARDHNKSIRWLRKMVDLVDNDPQLISEYSYVYGNLGTNLWMIGDYDEAEKVHKKGIEMLTPLQGCGNEDVDYYLALEHLDYANVFIIREDRRNAVEEAKKTLQIMEDLYEKNKEDWKISALTTEAYLRLGEWYDSFDESVAYLKKALSFTLKTFEKESSQAGGTLAQIYDDLAHVFQDKKRYKEAVEYYEAEIKVLDQLIGIEYQDLFGNTSEERRLNAMSHLADVLRYVGRETESINMMEQLFLVAIDVADYSQPLLTETLVYSLCSSVVIYINTLKAVDDKNMQIDISLLIDSLTHIMRAKEDSWDIFELSNLIQAGLFVIIEAFDFYPAGYERFKKSFKFFESVRVCIENIKNYHDSAARQAYNYFLAQWYHLKGEWIFNNGGNSFEALTLLTMALDLLTIVIKQLSDKDVFYEEYMKELEEIFTEQDLLHTFIENRDVLPEGIPILHKGELHILKMKHMKHHDP